MKRWPLFIVLLGLLALTVAHAASRAGDITVGVTVSLTGKYAKFGKEELNGMQMWVEDLNARGALLGRKVRLVHYDDRSDRKESARLYERLITKDKVDLLLGPYSSGLTLAASTVAEKHQFPMVATGAASSRIWARGYKNIFGIETPATHYMDLVVELLHKGGVDRIALFYAGTDFPREVAEGVRTQATKYGLTIVFDEEYDKDSTAFSDLAKRMARTQPEVVIGGTYLDDSVAFVRAAKKSSLNPQAYVFTVGPAVREFGDRLGADAEGM
ncbi:MAG: amino acid ABC transporter substrate-binding protein, partial [Gammaproteobacteria bacterium]